MGGERGKAGGCSARRRTGLTILKKRPDGKWVFARDANLLA
jgi:hypothetical protein